MIVQKMYSVGFDFSHRLYGTFKANAGGKQCNCQG